MLDKNTLEILKVFSSLKEAYDFLNREQSGILLLFVIEKEKPLMDISGNIFNNVVGNLETF